MNLKIMFMLLCLASIHQTLYVHAFTMQELVQEACITKPSLQSAIQDITTEKAKEKQIFTSYLPNINISTEVSSDTNASDAASGTVASVFAVDARTTFFDMTKVGESKAAQCSIQAAHAEKNDTLNKIRAEVETRFLQAWLLQKKNELMNLKAAVANLVFAQAQAKHTLGLLNKNDFKAASAIKNQELSFVKQYKNEYHTAYALLEQAIGKKLESVSLTFDAHQEIPLFPLDLYLQKAQQHRQDLKKQSFEIDKAAANFNKTWWQPFPKTSIFTTLTKTNNNAPGEFFSPGTSIVAGLKLNWSLFDAANTIFEKERLESLRLRSILDKNDLSLRIRAEVTTAYHTIFAALQQLDPQKIALEQALLDFKRKKTEHAVGLISDVDFQIAKLTYKTAEFDWFTIKIDAVRKERALLLSCGYPY